MSTSVIDEQNNDRVIGQVKWFNTKTGYGFITAREGEHIGKDIFTHYSSVRVKDTQYKYLVQGEYVELSIVRSTAGQHEYQSADVSGVRGGGLMCETRLQNSQIERENPAPVRKYKTRTGTGIRSNDDVRQNA